MGEATIRGRLRRRRDRRQRDAKGHAGKSKKPRERMQAGKTNRRFASSPAPAPSPLSFTKPPADQDDREMWEQLALAKVENMIRRAREAVALAAATKRRAREAKAKAEAEASMEGRRRVQQMPQVTYISNHVIPIRGVSPTGVENGRKPRGGRKSPGQQVHIDEQFLLQRFTTITKQDVEVVTDDVRFSGVRVCAEDGAVPFTPRRCGAAALGACTRPDSPRRSPALCAPPPHSASHSATLRWALGRVRRPTSTTPREPKTGLRRTESNSIARSSTN